MLRRLKRTAARLSGVVRDRGQTLLLPNGQLDRLVFGQQHVYTQDYFEERTGSSHTVPLRNTPHFECVSSGDPERDGHEYLRYLEVSWAYKRPGSNTGETRQARLRRFSEQYELVRRVGRISNPIRVFERPDGRLVVIDGNHRSVIAMALGLDLPAILVPPSVALNRLADVRGEFYGSERLRMPYQSLFFKGQELVRGRRPDVERRMKMILSDDLRDASVLDLGCNIGANCFLATEFGAASAHGIELSPRIATAAIRLNAFFAAPCKFLVHDLSSAYEPDGSYDVVFCFSLVAHLPDPSVIVDTIRRVAGKVLYFEGHANTTLGDYSYLLNSDNFTRIDLVGYGQNGVHDRSLVRPLFRCTVNNSQVGRRKP